MNAEYPRKAAFSSQITQIIGGFCWQFAGRGKPAGLLFDHFSLAYLPNLGKTRFLILPKMRDLKIPFVSIEALKPPGVISRMAAAFDILAPPPQKPPREAGLFCRTQPPRAFN